MQFVPYFSRPFSLSYMCSRYSSLLSRLTSLFVLLWMLALSGAGTGVAHAVVVDENENEILVGDPSDKLTEARPVTSCQQLPALKAMDRRREQTELDIVTASAPRPKATKPALPPVVRQADTLTLRSPKTTEVLTDVCDEFNGNYRYFVFEGAYWPEFDSSAWVIRVVTPQKSEYLLVDTDGTRYPLVAQPIFNVDHKKFVLMNQSVVQDLIDTVMEIYEYRPGKGWSKEFQARFTTPCNDCNPNKLTTRPARWISAGDIRLQLQVPVTGPAGEVTGLQTRENHLLLQYDRWYLK